MNSPKRRHWCLTALLILSIIGNGYMLLGYLAMRAILDYPFWLIGILNVIFAVALLKWMRWGFYGLVATSLMAFGLNLYCGDGVLHSAGVFIKIAVLYGVLQIGGKTSGWAQLEPRREPCDQPGSGSEGSVVGGGSAAETKAP